MSNYKDNETRAQDNKSSAWVLTVIGIIGNICLVLGLLGIIPIKVGNPYFFYGVLFALFIVFVVMGIVSFFNSKKFEIKAKSENSLVDSIIQWSEKNLTSELIDSSIDDAELSVEEIYFKRIEIIADHLNKQFVNLDPEFVDNLIDSTIYDMIFGE